MVDISHDQINTFLALAKQVKGLTDPTEGGYMELKKAVVGKLNIETEDITWAPEDVGNIDGDDRNLPQGTCQSCPPG